MRYFGYSYLLNFICYKTLFDRRLLIIALLFGSIFYLWRKINGQIKSQRFSKKIFGLG
jgi:hypothetical protein